MNQKQAVEKLNHYGNLAARADRSGMDFVPDSVAAQEIRAAKAKLSESVRSASELLTKDAYDYLYSSMD